MEDTKLHKTGLKSYEKWWTNNLGNNTYMHLGKQFSCPSVESFETWMGDKDSPDRIIVGQLLGEFRSILDAGCGACPEYYRIKEIAKDVRYTGVDITEKLVEYNVSRGINCHLGSLEDLPFDDNSFDVVISRHVVEHMRDIELPLREMIRVAQSRIVISFFIDPLENRTNAHVVKLDDHGTIHEVYHNRYSKALIEVLLLESDKVAAYRWVSPMPTPTSSALVIDIAV